MLMKFLILVLYFLLPAYFFCQPVTGTDRHYSIEQYLNIRGAGSPQYSPDDSKIYFISTVTGSAQIWMVDKPGSWPFQVTYYDDRVSSFTFNPKREIILMEKDNGGSEYDQFYLLKPDGTSIEQVTENKPKILYSFGRWFNDGSAFTFFSNERNVYYNDIYRYNIDNRSVEQLYSSDHSNYPSAISPDGKLMIINRSYSSYDNDLILLDVETKEYRLITSHNNMASPAEFYSISFSTDSKKIYINSNYNSEYYSLFEYDIENKILSKSDLPFAGKYSEYDLSDAEISDDCSKAFLTYNVNGYDEPVMYDFDTKKLIQLPEIFLKSNIGSVNFGNATAKLVLSVNSAKFPSVIYQWDYNSNIVEQVTYPGFAGVDPSSFVEPELVNFNTFDGLVIPCFVYYPRDAASNKKLPCIIDIHGGPEGQARYGFNSIIQFYVNAGYVVAEPNVRGSTGYGKKYALLDNIRLRENSVKDIASLAAYLKSTGRVDAGKIAVTGGSYGGYMVLACLTLYPELFAAGIETVGISNFVTFLQNTAEYRRYNRQGEYGSLEMDADFLRSISPVNKVDRIKAPLMIIHGKNDPRVPVGEATQMYDAIIKNGGIAELLIYDDEGHGLSKLKNKLDAYPKMVRFLDKYVKGK